MPVCPNCAAELNTVRQREGLFFECPTCHGRAVTIPQIRRVAGDRFATSLLRQINANQNFGGRACAFCTRPMRLFHSEEPPLELDACKACGVVWFDPQEFETVPEGFLESSEAARLRGVEADAKWRLERLQERDNTDAGPDEAWKTIPALFGFPVESETPGLKQASVGDVVAGRADRGGEPLGLLPPGSRRPNFWIHSRTGVALRRSDVSHVLLAARGRTALGGEPLLFPDLRR